MTLHNSSHWSDGLLPVVYGINTRLSVVTKTTPYQVMFGQPHRSDSDFWKLVKENEVIDDFNDDIMEDKRDDLNDCADIIHKDVIQLVQQLSDNAAASALVGSSSPHSSPIKPQ
ncbi:unnamed protein product [Rotaria sp. Silwood1]|nr:unnamed protein product [Rotaria sp. Silwood1]CAF0932681.1 unnamed protein product [Rotaria sp. Silwood1]CAF1117162.1 unnamed protein product [Rotaria sp. Silwood1]CAF3414972.1 unnamed protein product [Rotaria sp. Silwood1]CAF3454154.1 unnamed protein product [Rotaria sp. Silwood1]